MLTYQQKLHFWLKIAGWFCLLPASAHLYLYEMMRGTTIAPFFIGELIIIVIFGVYLLTTANLKRWEKPRNVMTLLLFSFVFVSIFELIPLGIAYANCKKINQ